MAGNYGKQGAGAVAWFGPWLVASGAFLWATDSYFRAQVVAQWSPYLIVLINHLLCAFFFGPALWFSRREFRALKGPSWFSLLMLSGGSSVLAMVLFTQAFATAGNFTVPILIQKVQPMVTIIAARIFLKERLKPRFLFWALLAMAGAWLVAFEDKNVFSGVSGTPISSALCAFGAAAIWGIGTVAGRSLTSNHSFHFVTAARYFFGSIIMVTWLSLTGEIAQIGPAISTNFYPFLMMALGPGYIALWIYYWGLSRTRASVATLCELAFPLGAIALNWLTLGSVLSLLQMIGAGMLLAAVTVLGWQQKES